MAKKTELVADGYTTLYMPVKIYKKLIARRRYPRQPAYEIIEDMMK